MLPSFLALRHLRRAGERRRPRGGSIGTEVTLAALALLALVWHLSTWPASVPVRLLPGGLERLSSGLLMGASLQQAETNEALQDQFNLDGSAGPKLGWASATNRGLLVGVRQHAGWAGWFAETIHAAGPGVAWHVEMTPGTLGGSVGRASRALAVFAVQTATTQANAEINYVVVAAVSSLGKYRWLVGYADGIVANASTKLFWSSRYYPMPPGPLLPAKAVTVLTNGRTSLAVWLDDREVFQSDHLRLRVAPPFQAYLEVQSSGQGYLAQFDNFWAAKDSPLVVRGAQPGEQVRLFGPGHELLATAVAGRNGTAKLQLPTPRLVGTATLTLTSRGFARSYHAVPYAGGDVVEVTKQGTENDPPQAHG